MIRNELMSLSYWFIPPYPLYMVAVVFLAMGPPSPRNKRSVLAPSGLLVSRLSYLSLSFLLCSLSLSGISFTSLIAVPVYFQFSLPPYPLSHLLILCPLTYWSPLSLPLSLSLPHWYKRRVEQGGGGGKGKHKAVLPPSSSCFPADITGFSCPSFSLLNILFLTQHTTQFFTHHPPTTISIFQTQLIVRHHWRFLARFEWQRFGKTLTKFTYARHKRACTLL